MTAHVRGKKKAYIEPGTWASTAEAHDRWCLSDEALHLARKSGLVTPVEIRGMYIYEADEIIAWLKSVKTEKKSEAA